MRRIGVTIAAIGIFLTAQLPAQQTMRLDARLSKVTYLQGEPIDFGLTLVNSSNTTITRRLQEIVHFRVVDENNVALPYKGRVMYSFSELRLSLKPNQETYPVFDLVELHGREYEGAPIYLYIPPGNYTVEIDFSPPGSQIQKTRIDFQVVEPQGEEAIVYRNMMGVLTRKNTLTEEVETFESLRAKYPNSVYVPFLLENLDVCYDIEMQDHSRGYATRKELVERYPSSYIAGQMLEGVLKGIGSDSERVEFLKKIHEDSRGSVMEKVIGKRLQAEIDKDNH